MSISALLHGSSIAATSWIIDDQPHLRVYTQDFNGGIRESRSDEGKWTGGTSKDVIVKAKPYSSIAALNVDGGAKIHVFYLNSEDFLCEIIRDASGNWSDGPLNHRKYKASPVSRLSAFGKSRSDQMSLQHQVPSGALNEVSYQDETVDWVVTWSGDISSHEKAILGTGLASFTFPTTEGSPGARIFHQLSDGTFAESGFEGRPGLWNPDKRIPEITAPAAYATNIAAASNGNESALAFRFHFIDQNNTPTEWGFYGGKWRGPNHPGHTKAAPGSGIATVSASDKEDSWKLYIQQGSQVQEYFFKRGMSDWEKGDVVPTGDLE